MTSSQPADRPLIGGKRDAQHRGLTAKDKAPVRRVSILGAEEREDAVLVNPLFDPQELDTRSAKSDGDGAVPQLSMPTGKTRMVLSPLRLAFIH